jgi:hypothetical protein
VQRKLPDGQHQASHPNPGRQPMEDFASLIAALPVSLILVIGCAWWIFRR